MPDPTLARKRSIIETIFETILWKSRFIVILAVIFGMLSSLMLFIVASYEVLKTMRVIFPLGHVNYAAIVGAIIGAVDLYLIGTVILLFSFGIYELFISKIDIARQDNELNLLEISNLDELKNRIIKLIVIVLIVSFFKQILEMTFTTPLELLFFALSIFAVSASVFFLKKNQD